MANCKATPATPAWTAGRLLTVTDAGGRVTRYTYDALGRRSETVVDPDGLALTTTYAYDAVGNTVRSQSGEATTFYVYDADNRVLFSVDGLGSAVQTSYDENGNVVRALRYANAVNLATWTAMAKRWCRSTTEPAIDAAPA